MASSLRSYFPQTGSGTDPESISHRAQAIALPKSEKSLWQSHREPRFRNHIFRLGAKSRGRIRRTWGEDENEMEKRTYGFQIKAGKIAFEDAAEICSACR